MTTRVCFQCLFGIISWKFERKWYKGDPGSCSLCPEHSCCTGTAWKIKYVWCVPASAMESVSGLSSGKRSVGSSKALMSCTNSEPREVFNDCAALLSMIRGTDCRKYDEKHENHVLYKIRNRKIIPFHWESIQLLTWSIQCQVILWHYFSVTCFHWIITRHRNFMIFINFLELNNLDTNRPTEERQSLGNITSPWTGGGPHPGSLPIVFTQYLPDVTLDCPPVLSV